MKLTIINYGAGNVFSVKSAFERLGLQPILSANEEDIRSSGLVVFPGVGHAESAMIQLKATGLDAVIPTLKQPVLGVCLGMQCLMERSEEGQEPGLGWIPGKVVSLKTTAAEQGLTWPHIGWDWVSSTEGEALGRFYFTHGYACQAEDSRSISHECAFGQSKITVGLKAGHIQGFQFHPEKSHQFGEKLLHNFAKL